MPDIFSTLSSMGLNGLSGVKIFEDEEEKAEAKEASKVAAPVIKEEDFLFEKKLKCPVCDKEFKSKTVKAGKARLVGSDSDLRPKYQDIDTVKYDAIVCPYCGYAALTRFYGNLTSFQVKTLKDNIGASFKGIQISEGALSYDDAIEQHKLVLLNAVVRKSKISERAYICLKLAWLYRGKNESLDIKAPDYRKLHEDCTVSELEFIKNAYEGFTACLAKELFPICGMDENTFNYLLADLARQCGKYDDALRLASRVIVSPNANSKIKDKARNLKDLIKR